MNSLTNAHCLFAVRLTNLIQTTIRIFVHFIYPCMQGVENIIRGDCYSILQACRIIGYETYHSVPLYDLPCLRWSLLLDLLL